MKAIILAALAATAYANKKGLAYNDGSITALFNKTNGASWAYNWGTALNAPKFEQVPMYWGPGSQGDSAGVLAKIAKGNAWVLGYNEPDETTANGGCNKTPEGAHGTWGNDMFKFADKGSKLVCPAISSWDTTAGHTGGPAGLTWLRKFVAAFAKPTDTRCSAQALHWYGADGSTAAAQAQLFKDYVANAKTQVDKIFGSNMDIWITEFSPLPVGNVDVLANFLKDVIPWLDSQAYVKRYSPFMAEKMVTNGALNAAGNAFINTN